ncbi:glucan 1,3 beta-glucosidase [Coprinellus micaceus]|uniref:glucan endo-1,3-beta-D-glucosidase n=1 Tax=Coprinellus micaceus TaxID=71717 RepID=A0A4Y7T7T6_COPMI|nr:glucan 1,3 beta-glucosidase [Coprinellus micaceus]
MAYNIADEDKRRNSRRTKWLIGGGVLFLVILIAVGVSVGVVLSNRNKKNNSSSGSSSSNGDNSNGGNGGSGSNGTDSSGSSDASNFTKDPNLHKAFYGMAYTPEGALTEFGCTNTLETTIKDIQLMSQLTTRVRLYAADCNQTEQVLEAIVQTNVDMKVYIGNYILDDNHEAYNRQKEFIKQAIQKYGTKHIAGVTVGNEFMLNYVGSTGDPNGATGDLGAAILIQDIEDTRAMLKEIGVDSEIPVGNSDAGSYFSTKVLSAVDYGLSNVHAWFAQTSAADSAAWVFQFFDEQNVVPAAALPNKPDMYIAESGWPTKSSDAEHATNGGPGVASEAGLQDFLDTFVCQANTQGVKYFFFEMFDEDWKDKKFGGVEGWWGLFNKDRTLKNVKIPTCTAP